MLPGVFCSGTKWPQSFIELYGIYRLNVMSLRLMFPNQSQGRDWSFPFVMPWKLSLLQSIWLSFLLYHACWCLASPFQRLPSTMYFVKHICSLNNLITWTLFKCDFLFVLLLNLTFAHLEQGNKGHFQIGEASGLGTFPVTLGEQWGLEVSLQPLLTWYVPSSPPLMT